MFDAVTDIDWQKWVPAQRATLLFIIHNDKMLLIHKKRGLGAGKINAPGGRLEPGETPQQAAIRETKEEICVEPVGVEYCGELSFQFRDGLSLYCNVFKATDYQGSPCETSEAIPLWVRLDQIPYEKMWQDDRYWVPLMLKGKKFRGFFIFDKNRMIDYKLESQ